MHNKYNTFQNKCYNLIVHPKPKATNGQIIFVLLGSTKDVKHIKV